MLARQPKSARYRDMERKPRGDTGIHMNEAQERFRPALFRQARYRPPARRVWLDWTATVPQPQNGLALFFIEISCLSVSTAGHKNAW